MDRTSNKRRTLAYQLNKRRPQISASSNGNKYPLYHCLRYEMGQNTMPNVGKNSRVVVEYFLILLLCSCFSFLLVASLVRILVHRLKSILCDALSNKRRTPNKRRTSNKRRAKISVKLISAAALIRGFTVCLAFVSDTMRTLRALYFFLLLLCFPNI